MYEYYIQQKKTVVGWNLDIPDMEYRVREAEDGVYIEINDTTEGWIPLFGANNRGDFVGMPTCWPFDERSNPSGNEPNVIIGADNAPVCSRTNSGYRNTDERRIIQPCKKYCF